MYILSTWLSTISVNLDHLADTVFVRFFHSTVTLFFSSFRAVCFGRKSLCPAHTSMLFLLEKRCLHKLSAVLHGRLTHSLSFIHSLSFSSSWKTYSFSLIQFTNQCGLTDVDTLGYNPILLYSVSQFFSDIVCWDPFHFAPVCLWHITIIYVYFLSTSFLEVQDYPDLSFVSCLGLGSAISPFTEKG